MKASLTGIVCNVKYYYVFIMMTRKTTHQLFWEQGRRDQGPCFVDAALCHQDGLERRRHPNTCQPQSEEQLFKSAVASLLAEHIQNGAHEQLKQLWSAWVDKTYASEAPLKLSGSAPTPPDSPSG